MGGTRDLARTILTIFTAAALAVPVSAKTPEHFSALLSTSGPAAMI